MLWNVAALPLAKLHERGVGSREREQESREEFLGEPSLVIANKSGSG